MKKKRKVIYKNPIIYNFLIKSLISILLFLLFLIINKKDFKFKDIIYQKLYNNSISFAKINHWYESYFGSLFPIRTMEEVQVFNESLSYNDKEKYEDGVLLKVNNNYIVPSINSGIIIYIGEKEKYGKTIIIEDETGVDTWYSNIDIGNINIYDYVEKGEYLGEAKDGNLIIVFQKDGQYIDYEKYI